jgi:hypothetical protein
LRAARFYPSIEAPTLNQQGGQVTNGFQVIFRKPRRGTIFFTLDGNDPRLPGGGVAPSARRYTPGEQPGPSTVPASPGSDPWPRMDKNTVLKSRVQDGNQWSALNEAFFQSGPAALATGEVRIAEIRSDAVNEGVAEFVELSNVSSQAINLRGARFTEGIDYAFADHRDTLLAPGQKLVLVKDLFRFRQQHGVDTTVEGIYSRKKKKRDSRITLGLKSGAIITSQTLFSP